MLVSLINEIKEGNNRVLIFSQFTSFLELVRRTLDEANEKYLYLDGSTNMKQREKMVKQFQQGECPLFLISLKAGGLGLNLTGANYVIHLDPWWNPAIEQQATDRAYRIGQQKKSDRLPPHCPTHHRGKDIAPAPHQTQPCRLADRRQQYKPQTDRKRVAGIADRRNR